MSESILSGKVLWIEDENDIRDMVTLILTSNGAVVQPYSCGHAALKDYDGGKVDLVITDFQMPSMSGAEVIARIRENDPDTPVILITGLPDRETITQSAHDFFAVLSKPFDASELIQTVKNGIRHKRKTRTV